MAVRRYVSVAPAQARESASSQSYQVGTVPEIIYLLYLPPLTGLSYKGREEDGQGMSTVERGLPNAGREIWAEAWTEKKDRAVSNDGTSPSQRTRMASQSSSGSVGTIGG